MFPIATSGVLSGSTNGFIFTNIPQTFTHLQVRGFLRDSFTGSTNQSMTLNFNNDFTNNYSVHRTYGDGSGTASQGFASQGAMFQGSIPTAIELANVYGVIITDILDYTNTNKNKTIKSISGYDKNGGGAAIISSGAWYNTAAITQINCYESGNSAQYSRIDLYGISISPATGA
jgi:hypothetical protein